MHPRNKHTGRYDFDKLIACNPDLASHVIPNIRGDQSIDFANPKSVLALNNALLQLQYGIEKWEIPEGYLCPPIPGRADYLHHMADLLRANNYGRIPTGEKVQCLDIGIGSSCIYPIIGRVEYEWSFIGSDIDETALQSSQKILDANPKIGQHVELRLQTDKSDVLFGIIRKEDRIDLTVCNPPFHSSAEEAKSGSLRKVRNLKTGKGKEPQLNFGGQSHELWCDGGERKFISNLVRESKKFSESCFWYSTLVSKQSHLKAVYAALKDAGAEKVETIPMGHGNKTTRIVAWTFLTSEQQREWKDVRWNGRKPKEIESDS